MSYTIYHSWSTARLVAIAAVAVALVVIGALGALIRNRPRAPKGQDGQAQRFGGMFNGLDNRWSTSKVAIVLWTAAIAWAFVAILIRYGGSAAPASVPAAYLALLGIPSAGALGAKAITSQNADNKTIRNSPTGPLLGPAQVFTDDTGAVDLLDSQYFLFNLVLLGFFVASFWHITDPTSGTDIALPTLPGSLLALAGVSTASYLGKKALSGATNQVQGGSSLTVTADSDVALPGGGTIKLPSPGEVTIYPGVTYTPQTGGTASTVTGGRLDLTTGGQVKLAVGATVTGPAGSVTTVTDATAIPTAGLSAKKPDGVTDADDAAGALGKALPAGSTIRLAPAGRILVTSDESAFALPAGVAITYADAGVATVEQADVTAVVSAGATLGQELAGNVTFPAGASYVDATNPGPVQPIAPGQAKPLQRAAGATPAQSIILNDSAKAILEPGTTVTFPDRPTPINVGVKTTATSPTTLSLPSGGSIVIEAIDPAKAAIAAHIPNGATVSVDAGAAAATVTATVAS